MIMNKIRPIRSFVHRERKLGKIRQTAVQELWNQYVLKPQEMLDVKKLPRSINIEIGFGMGEALFEIAKNQPDEFFIGIEVHLPGVAALLTKLKNEPLNNLKIYHHDALEILQNCIPSHCIDKIFLFFPDPWPKNRHHKRRIVQSSFMELIHKKLKYNGYFYAATDIEDYAIHITKIAAAGNFTPTDTYNLRPPTKFENRGIQAGRKIWDLVFIKNNGTIKIISKTITMVTHVS